MGRYFVLSPVEHDGVRYEEGSIIELDEDASSQLLESGALGDEVAADEIEPNGPMGAPRRISRKR